MHIGLGHASHIRLGGRAISGYMAESRVKGEHWHSAIATNLRALKDQAFGGSINAMAARVEINQSTLNRYCNGSISMPMEKIDQVADKTGYAAWQLLHPDFDTRRMPPMMDARAMRVAAVFANIAEPRDRDRAEAIIEQFAPD